MSNFVTCVVCRTRPETCRIIAKSGGSTAFECSVCGDFSVSDSALRTVLDPEMREIPPIVRAAISHRLREANEAGRPPPMLDTTRMKQLVADARLPSPAQQATNIVRYFGDIVSKTGRSAPNPPPSFTASIGSPNREFALGILRQLVQRGLLIARTLAYQNTADEPDGIDLTLDGWGRYEAEKRGEVVGTTGFIALKFGDPVLDPFVREVIKPAVASIGYTLEDMRDAAEAGIIDNVMRARIRDAAFVLVDLTHANAGAYWEAGYAEGLGKPVLYLCEASVFTATGTHFDTNHCTTVTWDVDKPDIFTIELVATLRRSLGLFPS